MWRKSGAELPAFLSISLLILAVLTLTGQDLPSLIQVERIGIREGKRFQQTNYYISSLATSAVEFAQGIREHWGIENCLHWVKDVIFGEDAAPFRNYNAATNWSFIRTIVINVARLGGYDSQTIAERFLGHDINKLFSLLE